MKIRSVTANNRKKAFEVRVGSRSLIYPYSRSEPRPTRENRVADAAVDDELGREGFTYTLASGDEGSVHVEQVLEYNQDPAYLRDSLLYQLTLEVQRRVEASPLSKREIIRRLSTSATQFYRLLDQTNYRKSIDSMLDLLHVLDCEVELTVRGKHPVPDAS